MILKCVGCGTSGLLRNGAEYQCARCDARYPIVGGIPRFVGGEFYSGSFGFQWKRFARTQLDSANGTTQSRDTFVEKTGWPLGDLKGATGWPTTTGTNRTILRCRGANNRPANVSSSSTARAIIQAGCVSCATTPSSFSFAQ